MEVILEIATILFYHGLGRLIFGKTFDTGEKVLFWKKIFLGLVALIMTYALITFIALSVGYFYKVAVIN